MPERVEPGAVQPEAFEPETVEAEAAEARVPDEQLSEPGPLGGEPGPLGGEPEAIGAERDILDVEAEAGEAEELPPEPEPEFEIPEQLAEAFRAGEVVVFAGAGVSTAAVFPFTLSEEVAAEMPPGGLMSFPELMGAYEAQEGRMGLLERIKERLEYAKSFPELDREATRFHRELSSAFTISEMVTTNWDDYFERACGATPFTTERDWAFWRFGTRKVFKLHGSITSPATVVATAEDYKRRYEDLLEGLIGEKLEIMLRKKTVVLVGYAYRDDDFNGLCDMFERRMKALLPRVYVVTRDDERPPDAVAKMNVLRTDEFEFLEKLKQCYAEGELLPDERFEGLLDLREDVRVERALMLEEGEMREDPEMLFAASYQEGLIHACEHITANKPSGEYPRRRFTEDKIEMYRELAQEKLEAGQYEDVAYIEGYLGGLTFLLADDDERESVTPYFVFGHAGELVTHEDFRKAASTAPQLDAEAHEHGVRMAAELEPGAVYRHTTFIF